MFTNREDHIRYLQRLAAQELDLSSDVLFEPAFDVDYFRSKDMMRRGRAHGQEIRCALAETVEDIGIAEEIYVRVG